MSKLNIYFIIYTTFENNVAKEEIADDEQFLFRPQCFQLYSIVLHLFIEIFHILSRWFQSRLLQICCIWIKDKVVHNYADSPKLHCFYNDCCSKFDVIQTDFYKVYCKEKSLFGFLNLEKNILFKFLLNVNILSLLIKPSMKTDY